MTPTTSGHRIIALFVLVLWALLPCAPALAADFPIYTLADLQAMKDHLTDRCILMNDIDASDTRNWNDGKGFEPVGRLSGPGAVNEEYFRGSFEGNGHTIRNLYINRTDLDFVGLFAGVLVTGERVSIANVVLENVDITGRSRTAPLVSRFHSLSTSDQAVGVLSNCSASGTVHSESTIAGGLVAVVLGPYITVMDCHSSCRVSGPYSIGGLTGVQSGSSLIVRCSTAGTVTCSGSDSGGMVGNMSNNGRVLDCISSSDVIGVNNAGGVIGSMTGMNSAERCCNLGQITASGSNVGGVIGYLDSSAFIRNAYSVAHVTGSANVGGFAGQNNGGTIQYSYCQGLVNGPGGNFVGLFNNPQNTQGLLQYNYWNVTVSGSTNGHVDNQMEGLTEIQMVTPTSFETWDFNAVWAMEQSEGFKTAPFFRFGGGSGTANDPYRITHVYGLQGMGLSQSLRASYFIQTKPLDAAITKNWNNGAGFIPAGLTEPFNGRFNGNGFGIRNLYINIPMLDDPVGLFGTTGATSVIENVILDNVKVVGGAQTGGLVGLAKGLISNCAVTGKIYGGGFALTGAFILIVGEQMFDFNAYSGGLAGFLDGGQVDGCTADVEIKGLTTSGGLFGRALKATVRNSRSRGSVYGNTLVGGFSGMIMDSRVELCESRVDVHGNTAVGGFAGYLEGGGILRCVSTGSVSGFSMVGGFLGLLQGAADQCWCSGTVKGSFDTGGFAGIVQALAKDCMATGAVTGDANTGGFAGYMMPGGSLVRCYSKGKVAGVDECGGFVGFNSVEDQDYVSCFWDMTGSGWTLSKAGSGLTRQNLVSKASYPDWDFVQVWIMNDGVLPPFPAWDAQGADLSVTLSPHQDTLESGAGFSYTITLLNKGPYDALSIILSTESSPGLEHMRCSFDGGLTWMPWESRMELGDLAVGQILTLRMEGNTAAELSDVASLTLSADFDGHEFDRADNTATQNWAFGRVDKVTAGDGSGCFISSVHL